MKTNRLNANDADFVPRLMALTAWSEEHTRQTKTGPGACIPRSNQARSSTMLQLPDENRQGVLDEPYQVA